MIVNTTTRIAHLLMLPMSFHEEKKIGEVGEKISRAAFSLETIVGRIVIDLAPQFLSILIALGIGFYLNVWLALALVAGSEGVSCKLNEL